jgi:cardiolipin synthase
VIGAPGMETDHTTNGAMGSLWTIPNVLTLIRILLIPFFLILLLKRFYPLALGLFAIGGLTDAFDGMIARRTKRGTRLGSYLDPLADKLLITSTYLALGAMEIIPFWLMALVLGRDLIILCGYGLLFLLIQERMDAQPTRIGKVSTGFQIVTVALILTELSGAPIGRLLPVSFGFTAALTAVSGVHYTYRGVRWFFRQQEATNGR